MSENKQFDNISNRDSASVKLAQWLQHLLTAPDSVGAQFIAPYAPESSTRDYHLRFYQQLPDFIVALLHNDAQATTRYAPLLYHLAGCTVCRTAYIELYDALGYALNTHEVTNVSQVGRPFATMSSSAQVQFCHALISQAEAVARQARHEHDETGNGEAEARSLLQMAMRVSAQITQSSVRTRALQDLVRVANLAQGVLSAGDEPPALHSYAPLIGAGGTRQGKVMRKVDTVLRSAGTPTEPPAIYLQSHPLEGSIVQHDNQLELHLHDLNEKLRGHYATISIPLGGLIEPVRWVGGNPRAIRSTQPVNKDGTLVTPLGETELHLTIPDERSLLEVMFLLLEVRPAD
ncbi:MAG TPA: hypothetical protein VEV19_08595 [Ktedonobacteraceae bacterium]|nr:hypothetical protein [Ktedonobacteraceae bacterium]